MLAGKKTYIVAAGFIVYAVSGYLVGALDLPAAIQAAMQGGGLAALRNAL